MNPRTARMIGYIILFVGIIIFGIGCIFVNFENTVSGIVLCIIAVPVLIASFVWIIRKVRCPHCGALLHLKLYYPISKCPYCGKNTDDCTF